MDGVSQALTTLEVVQIIGAAVIGAIGVAVAISPRLRRLEARLAAMYFKDVPPEVRAELAAFWATLRPVIVAKLPSVEAYLLHSTIAGELTGWLAAKGVNLTTGQIVGLAAQFLREAQQAQADTQAVNAAQAAAAKAQAAAKTAENHSGIATQAAGLAQRYADNAEGHSSDAQGQALAAESQAVVAKTAAEAASVHADNAAAAAKTATGTQTAPADAATPALAVPEAERPGVDPTAARAASVAAGE